MRKQCVLRYNVKISQVQTFQDRIVVQMIVVFMKVGAINCSKQIT